MVPWEVFLPPLKYKCKLKIRQNKIYFLKCYCLIVNKTETTTTSLALLASWFWAPIQLAFGSVWRCFSFGQPTYLERSQRVLQDDISFFTMVNLLCMISASLGFRLNCILVLNLRHFPIFKPRCHGIYTFAKRHTLLSRYLFPC